MCLFDAVRIFVLPFGIKLFFIILFVDVVFVNCGLRVYGCNVVVSFDSKKINASLSVSMFVRTYLSLTWHLLVH